MIVWDPDVCAINEEIRVEDYLGPTKSIEHSTGTEPVRVVRKKKAGYKK
jgi:hypothetical protein